MFSILSLSVGVWALYKIKWHFLSFNKTNINVANQSNHINQSISLFVEKNIHINVTAIM